MWDDLTPEEQEALREEQRGLYASDEFLEQTMPGGVSHIPTSSPREEMLNELIVSGDLKLNQAQDIINLTTDSMSLETVAGYISGEYNIPPQSIGKALEGSDVTVDVANIEEQKRNFLRTAGDVGGSVTRFLLTPFQAAAGGIHTALGTDTPFEVDRDNMLIKGREGSVFQEDAWYRDTEEERADKEQREEVRDRIRLLIDDLKEDGFITNDRATKMRSVTDNYDVNTAQDLYDELQGIFAGDAYSDVAEQYQVRDALALNALENRGALKEGAVVEAEGAEVTPEAIGADIEAGAAVETQGWGDFDSFRSLTQAMGYVTQQDQSQLPDIEKQTTTGLMIDFGFDKLIEYNFPEAIGPGKHNIMDRATGAVMTNEMYNLIQTDAALRKRYQELGKPTAATQQLLDSGKFNVSGQYTSAGRTQLGKTYLPVEDIGVPSVAPSKPWETQAYNWSLGSGTAQWSSMATYSRQAKVKYMISSGTATAAQAADYSNPFSLSGAQQWGRVLGVSRELQVSPYEAMNSMGREISRIRNLVNRKAPRGGGYRGGGGGGAKAPVYSVPASLREIPDYKTLAQRTKSIFSEELGRDMEDWEMSLLSDELKDKYTQAQTQRRVIHKAAWSDAVAGGSAEVDFTSIEEPLEAHQFDIGEKYESEINRNVRVEDRANNRNLLMNSISMGERMI